MPKKKLYIYTVLSRCTLANQETQSFESDQKYITGEVVTLEVPIVTNVNFLLMISIECQAIRL